MSRSSKISGYTLLEVVLAMVFVASGIYASATMFRTSEYNALKARIDGRVAGLLRYEVERTMCMPYSNALALSSTGGTSSTGFLYRPLMSGTFATMYPYTLTTAMVLSGSGTAAERIDLTTTVQWQEPQPDFTKSALVPKQVSTGTHTRRKY